MAIADFRTSQHFSALEKAVLGYAEALTATPARVPDELFRELAGYLDEAQLVELTAAIALENFSARFNRGLAIEAD